MYQRSSELPLSPQQSRSSSSVAAGVRAVLAELTAELGVVTQPTEAAFLRLGDGLAATVADLQRIEAGFADLSERIDGQDAVAAIHGIEQAVACIAELSQGNGEEAACLGRLADDIARLARLLAVLGSVAAEVGVLAMNAKIQAAQLVTGAADFSVFTVEMTRLAGLAQSTIDRAGAKVAALAVAIGRARADEEAFTRTSRAELAEVQERLGHGAAVLAERRRRAAAATQTVRERSRSEGVRVAESIGQLQINDITCQRVEHVRKALEVLDGVLAEDSADVEGDALVTAVCRLQQAQLGRTATDYRDQIDRLLANLRLMAADAGAIVDQAGAAFSDGSGGRASFVGPLEADIQRATRLLDGFVAARGRVHAVMEAVHASVTEIVHDLGAVTSIDADLQVMGLNATLKCGRLGSDGRALGVIAQELRVCGKRTEDNARTVSALLAGITDTAAALRRMADSGGQGRFAELQDAMAESLSRLDALAARLDDALARLERDGGRVARTLDQLAGGVRVHHDVGAALQLVSSRLAELGAPGDAAVESGTVRDRLRTLLAGHYTMESERLIHQLAAEDDMVEETHAPPAEAVDVDDCFL